jgi:hypothetical protein
MESRSRAHRFSIVCAVEQRKLVNHNLDHNLDLSFIHMPFQNRSASDIPSGSVNKEVLMDRSTPASTYW